MPSIACLVRSFIYSTPRLRVRSVNGVDQLCQSSCGGVRGGGVANAGGEEGRIGEMCLGGGVGVRGRF